MDTTMQVRPSEKKVLLGEVYLLPVDTIVEPLLWVSNSPFRRGTGQNSQYFNVGFKLRLRHLNFEGGVRELSDWLLAVGLCEFTEPERHYVPFLLEGQPLLGEMSSVQRAIKETKLSFEEFIADEYVHGNVSSERLRTFFVKHYRNPFGPVPRKRSRS